MRLTKSVQSWIFLQTCIPSLSFSAPHPLTTALHNRPSSSLLLNQRLTAPKRRISPALHARGGGSNDSSSSSYDSDSDFDTTSDSSDSYDVLPSDVITDPDSPLPTDAKPMPSPGPSPALLTQQSRSYLLSSMLWFAVAVDVLANKTKRSLLFPGASLLGGRIVIHPSHPYGISNVVQTVDLACGFVLAGGLSLLLSSQLLSSSAEYHDDGGRSVDIRRGIQFLLGMFAMGNLGPFWNSWEVAPFLGLSFGVICVHNLLISTNGWWRDVEMEMESNVDDGRSTAIGSTMAKELRSGAKSTWKSLIGTSFSREGNLGSYVVFTVAAQIFALRAIGVAFWTLLPHYRECFRAGSFAIAPVGTLQKIGLEWASLSRFVVASGLSLVLKEESGSGRLRNGGVVGGKSGGTTFVHSLNGLVALCSLMVAIPRLVIRSDVSSAWRLMMIAGASGSTFLKRYL